MKNSSVKPFREHLDKQYGKASTQARQAYEAGYEAFRLGAMLHELRKESGLTQDQFAQKCGTSKSYISRIENNASDVQLGTLIRILKQGFGKDLKLIVN